MSAPARQQVGKYKLLNEADGAHLSAYPDPDTPHDTDAQVVDCPYCGRTLRPRVSTERVRYGGDRLASAMTEHLFTDCERVEVTR